MMKRSRLPLLALAAALAIAGCTGPASDPNVTSAEAAPHASLDELADMSAVDLIAALEQTGLDDRRTDLIASVHPNQVVLTAGQQEITVPIPEGQHYLSIAPSINQTHECYFHSLTTCTGELGGQDVTIEIVDATTGEVYIDQEQPLEENGFAGVWLPQDITAAVTITSEHREGTARISTGDDDLTCLTSLQLR